VTRSPLRIWRGGALAARVAFGGLLALVGSSGVAPTRAADGPPAIAAGPPTGNRLGFVVTYFYYAMYQGEDACPNGMAHVTSSQEFLAKFSPNERERLLRSENRRELFQKMVERGPNGENVCRNPAAVPDPQMATLAGDRNDGLDLDGFSDEGAASSYTCPHKQYIGDDGGAGVDNQLGRVFACLSGLREKGTLTPYFTQTMRNGMWSMLIDISGVDDLRDDPDVTVDIYAGEDHMTKDPNGNVLAGASLAPNPDPRFHRQLKGRIKGGVLETTPIEDLVIPDIMQSNRLPPMRIERPRLKLTLLENGTARGYLGGYINIQQYDAPPDDRNGENEQYGGASCDGMHYALTKYADGARDAATGQCHALSTAFRIEAVPAFIVHPERQRIRSFDGREPP
jgi:hypothetical protein